jgi:hypothetical protein
MERTKHITVFAHDVAEAAASDWAICTMALPHHGIEVAVTGHRQLWLHYRILHPPQLPVRWPAWTTCYHIIEQFSILLPGGNPGKTDIQLI